MRASLIDDPLYQPDDDFDTPEPMKPIRLQYVTLTTERALLVDTIERLGLVNVWVGQQLYALNECDSTRVTLDATAALMDSGITTPTAEQVARRAQAMLLNLVLDSAGTVERSALRDPAFTAKAVGQQRRREADAILARHGAAIRANIAHAIAETEAA